MHGPANTKLSCKSEVLAAWQLVGSEELLLRTNAYNIQHV